MKSKREQIKDPMTCFICGSNNITSTGEKVLADSSGNASEEVRCYDCGSEYIEIYKMVDVKIIEPGMYYPENSEDMKKALNENRSSVQKRTDEIVKEAYSISSAAHIAAVNILDAGISEEDFKLVLLEDTKRMPIINEMRDLIKERNKT